MTVPHRLCPCRRQHLSSLHVTVCRRLDGGPCSDTVTRPAVLCRMAGNVSLHTVYTQKHLRVEAGHLSMGFLDTTDGAASLRAGADAQINGLDGDASLHLQQGKAQVGLEQSAGRAVARQGTAQGLPGTALRSMLQMRAQVVQPCWPPTAGGQGTGEAWAVCCAPCCRAPCCRAPCLSWLQRKSQPGQGLSSLCTGL